MVAMKFVFLTQYFYPEIGAAPVRLTAIVQELLRTGHEVEVVTAMPNYPDGKIHAAYKGKIYCRESFLDAVVHRVWLYAATGKGLTRIANYLSFCVFSLLGLLRIRRADYVFIESPPPTTGLAGIFAAKLFGARAVFNVADLWPDTLRELGMLTSRPALRALEYLEKFCYSASGFVNAVTDGIADKLEKEKNVDRRKILFLPNGVDTSLFRPSDPDPEILGRYGLNGKHVVLYAGTHSLGANMEVIADAAALLRERPSVYFLFVGDGPARESVQQRFEHHGLKNYMFLGSQQQELVARLFSVAAIGISTLRNSRLFEGTRPAKMFVGMSSGVPILYSGFGEGARILERSGAGIVTPPEDAEALADAICRLIDNPAMAAEMGRSGRRYVEQGFSWQAIVSNWLTQLALAESDVRSSQLQAQTAGPDRDIPAQ
jgi:colanic acid biosynthesis glycosyl transferase WcaI